MFYRLSALIRILFSASAAVAIRLCFNKIMFSLSLTSNENDIPVFEKCIDYFVNLHDQD